MSAPVQTQPVVVTCLGSSTTAGRGEAFDWIGALEKRPQNSAFRFHNLGVGGDLAYNCLLRLPSVVATRPDRVVVIAGANDILAAVFPNVRRFYGMFKGLERDPSPGWFRENLVAIVRGLKEKTEARIVVASLGEIGEDPTSSHPVQRRLNDLFVDYNRVIREVVREEDIDYISFYERLHELIAASPGRAFTEFSFLSIYKDAFRYYALRRSGDEIAEANDWKVHVDGVHLNSRGGMLLVGLVEEFLGTAPARP